MEDMCLWSERLLSKITPRLRADWVGERVVPWNSREGEVTFERCWGVPIRRYSVFDGLTVRRLENNQEWTVSRVDDRRARLVEESEAEKEM